VRLLLPDGNDHVQLVRVHPRATATRAAPGSPRRTGLTGPLKRCLPAHAVPGRLPDTVSMRPVIVAGNWKMNGLPTEAGALAASIAGATAAPAVLRVLCPPYVSLKVVADAVAGSGVEVGAQNVHAESGGAYTGEVSAGMLAGLASWAIVGHSERRRDQLETDVLIGRKLLRCAEAGLRPILCVGEQLVERDAGLAEQTVRDQLAGCLGVVLAAGTFPLDLVVAYEPVWAIGTGRTARGADAAAVADAIRGACAALGAPDSAAWLPVLYGGSVTSGSIGEFLAEPAIDGALVGGASLKVDEMAAIVARAALTAEARLAAADA
jgi:triosephosphate isomerase